VVLATDGRVVESVAVEDGLTAAVLAVLMRATLEQDGGLVGFQRFGLLHDR
jgi:hypothetical protein